MSHSKLSSLLPKQLFFAFLIVLPLFPASALARIRQVPQDYFSIQNAIDSAANGDTVLLGQGRFSENINPNGKSLTFASQFIFSNDPRDIAATILDGGWNGRSAIRVANGEGGVIAGFTIVNDSTDFGGGIYCRLGSMTIRNMVIEGCMASRNGGAIYITGGAQVTVRDVTLRNNSCGNVGGAMSIYTGAQATIERAVITGNYAAHVGGAIHAYGSRVMVNNCTIVNNAALHNGGGFYLTQSAIVELTNSISWNNEPHEAWVMSGFDETRWKPSFNLIQGYLDKVFVMMPENMEWGIGNIGGDPLFVDADNGDYRIQEGSPCIDAGHYESIPDPDGTRADLGAIAFDQGNGGQRVEIFPGDHNTIQEAIEARRDGDIVLVLPGTYNGNLDFSGKAITVASRSLSTGIASYADSTIIDAGGQGSVVMFANGEDERSILDGFTLRNGAGTWFEGQNYSGNVGGGIYCIGSSPLIRNCLLTGNDLGNLNRLTHGGGAFFGEGAHSLMQNVRITNNRAMYGAGMAIGGESHVRMEDVTISGNRATAGDDSWGGGIWCFEDASFEMEGGEISGNHAAGGGAIAMTVNGGTSAVRKAAIVDNEGYWGAAFYGTAFPMVFDQVTISGNNYPQIGDHVFHLRGRNSKVILRNSILYGNDARLFVFQDDSLSIDYSLIEGGEDSLYANERVVLNYGDGNFDADPEFTDPDNGGFTLAENSPCIDAGDPDAAPDPDGTRADVGAYYFHQVIEREPVVLRVPEEYATIQEAIDASQQDDTVLVDPGRYTENLNFNGKWITVGSLFLTTRDRNYISQTIIDGGGHAETVRFGRGETNASKLIGFTITGGNGYEGGGVFCLRASPEIAWCVITGNRGQIGGGGLYLYGSGALLNNLTIVGNDAGSGAGGIHLRNASYTYLTNCILYGNGDHEAVVSNDRDPCTIYVNYSDVEGGPNAFELNANGTLNWEEGNLAADPLFADVEAGDYRLREESPCIDAGDPESDADDDGSRADIGALGTFIDNRVVRLDLPLRAGWGFIGSPVILPDPQMPTVWSQQIESGNLFIVKDGDGRFFMPDRNYNGIPEWILWQGYAYKTREADTLRFEGERIDPETVVPMRQGWSFISYFPQDTIPVWVAFHAVRDDIILVKDQLGRFWNPPWGWEPGIELTSGTAVKVKTRRALEFVWGRGEDRRVRTASLENEPSGADPHFKVLNTGANMSVLITALIPAEAGIHPLELGAFTTDNLCVGASSLQYPKSKFQNSIGLAVWADDPTTPEIDGAREGEKLSFRLWDGVTEEPIQIVWEEGEGVYATDGFAVGACCNTPLPLEFGLGEPFPNPFNGTVTITFSTPVRGGRVNLSIYDLSGRLVERLVDGHKEAGEHQVVWNSKEAGTGLYFIRLEAGNQVRTRKMMLVK